MRKVYNKTQSVFLTSHTREATTLALRLKGLLGTSRMGAGEGMWISPCSSIHTFFMRFSIDACFVDKHFKIVRMYHSLAPFRVTCYVPGAIGVLEVGAGTLLSSHSQIDDQLSWELN